jgi:hypothetical protein
MLALKSPPRLLISLLLVLGATVAQKTNVLLITESASQEMNGEFMAGLKMAEAELTGETFDYKSVSFERKLSDTAYTDMCNQLKTGEYSAVVDLSWGGWIKGRKTANELGLPYLRMQSANHLYVQAADDFLRNQKSVDAALIFEDQVWECPKVVKHACMHF